MIEFYFKDGLFKIEDGRVECMNEEAFQFVNVIRRRWSKYCSDDAPCVRLEMDFFDEQLSRITDVELIRWEQSDYSQEF